MIGIIAILMFIVGLLGLPAAWLLMLALGNFGFAEFGLIDCIPAGMLISAIATNKGGGS